jgi:uncharacterized protein YjcR
MAKKDVLRKQAEQMFIELGYTAKDIAETLGIQEKTIGNWRKADLWDKRRNELLASPHKIKELLLKEFQSIAGGNAPTLDSDALSKVAKALAGVEDVVNPRTVITILKMLDEFSADIDPAKAAGNLEIHKRFILHIINLHG